MRSIIIGRQINHKLFSDTKHIEIFGVVFRLIYLQVNRLKILRLFHIRRNYFLMIRVRVGATLLYQ